MSVEFEGASASYAAVRGKVLSAAVRGKLSFRFVLLASSALSAIILPIPPAIAAIVGNDIKIGSSGNDAVGRVNPSGANLHPTIASQNSIALVGDADCHALSGVGLGDRVFDPTTIWGKGDADRTDGIYGFGEQKPLAWDVGNGLSGGTTNAGGSLGIPGEAGAPVPDPDLVGVYGKLNGLRYYQGANAGKGQKQGSRAWVDLAEGWRTGNVQNGPGKDLPNGVRDAWTQSLGVNSVAIGCDARANGYGSYAYGWGAWASGSGSYAQGINARATGQGTLALGIYARATGDDAIAQGSLAQASGSGATAIGTMTQATGANSVAIGSGDGSKAVASMNGTPGAAQTDGFGARAIGANTVALGYQAQATADGGAALASDALADRKAGVAGYDLKTKQASAVDSPAWKATRGAASVGDPSKGITRQIAGVAAGSDDTDAVNLAQLKQAAADSQSSSVLYDANTDGSRQNKISLIGGDTTKPVSITNLARGDTTSANSTDAVNGGQLYETNSNVSANTTAIGTNTTNITKNRTDLTTATANVNKFLGGGADIAAGTAPNYSIQGNSADNVGSAFANVNSSLTSFDGRINKNTSDITTINTSISNGSVGPVQRSATGNNLFLTAKGGTATVPGTAQRLRNLADGVSNDDAVNLRQLRGIDQKVDTNRTAFEAYTEDADNRITANIGSIDANQKQSDTNFGRVSSYLGGGVDIKAGTAPTYTVQGKTADNVGGAFGLVDTSLTEANQKINKNTSDITNINNGSVGPVRRTTDGNLTLTAQNGDAANPGTPQKLKNLADGTANDEAVNFGQLTATNNSVADNIKNIGANSQLIAANKTASDGSFGRVSSYLGGGATFQNGTWTAPTYTVQGKTADNVGGAFGLVDTSLTEANQKINKNTSDITNINNGSVGPVRRTTDGNLTLTAQNGDAANPGTPQKLKNLADGTANNEAVNFGQLKTTNTALDNYKTDADGRIKTNTDKIDANQTASDTKFGNVSTWLGGGADIKAGTAPSYTIRSIDDQGNVTSADHNNVGDALTSLDGNTSNVNSRLTTLTENIGKGELGPVRRAGEDNILNLVDKDGKTDTAQKLQNLAAGTADTDAVNFGQLKVTDGNVASNKTIIDTNTKAITDNQTRSDTNFGNVSTYLGGGADIKAGTAPTYTVQGKTADNVGGAFGLVDSSFETVNKSITDLNTSINNGSVGPVRRLNAGANILTLIDQGGKDGAIAQKLTNLDKGDLTADSKDAVNGSQLFATNKTIADNRLADNSQIASYFGGNATFQNGTWTAPTYTVQGKTADNVGEAFNNVDSSFETVNKSITDLNTSINNGSVGPVRRLNAGANILTLIDQGGKDGAIAQKLTNLDKGDLSADSKDAVNGSQLFATNTTIADNRLADNSQIASYLGGNATFQNGTWTAPTYTVQGKTADNVGGAFGLVDTSFETVNKSITDLSTSITTGKAGPVQRLDENANILTLIDRDKKGDTAQKLTNLDKGDLAEDSKDAVNGSQLFATNKTIADNRLADNSQIASYLGGNATFQNGTWTAPTYTVQGKTADNVGGAFGLVDTSFETVNKSITDLSTSITTGKAGPVQRLDENANILTLIDRDKKGDTAQKLTNLDKGDLSADSKDAVNGSQLFATNTTIADNRLADNSQIASYLGGNATFQNGTWTAPTYTVQGKTADNVGGAFGLVDTSFETVNKSITDLSTSITTGKAGPVQRLDENANILTLIDRDKKGDTAQKLTNLDKGDLAEDSKDAVNGSQLFATNKTIADNRLADNSQIASYFGGGAGFQGGLWTQPSYTIRSIDTQGQMSQITHNNVGDALGGLDNSVNNVNSHVNNVDQRVTNITDNITKGDFGPVRRAADGSLTLTAQGGDAANPGAAQKLTNLADGTLAKDSKDAVNGGQLFETNERVGKVETGLKTVEGKVTDLGGRVDKIGSVAENAVVYDTDKTTGKRRNSITLVGADSSQPVAINNVADGKIDKSSKQAVNGGQLHGVKEELVASIDQSSKDTLKGANLYTDNSSKATLRQANDYTDSRISNFADDAVDRANQYTDRRFGSLNRKIHNVRKEARSAAAIGLAAASLRFNDAPGKLSVGVGGGAWKSQGAFSFGAGYTDYSGKIRANVTGTLADGTVGVGGGVTFTLN